MMTDEAFAARVKHLGDASEPFIQRVWVWRLLVDLGWEPAARPYEGEPDLWIKSFGGWIARKTLDEAFAQECSDHHFPP